MGETIIIACCIDIERGITLFCLRDAIQCTWNALHLHTCLIMHDCTMHAYSHAL